MNTAEFIAEIAPAAVVDQMQSNVLASITIAQAMLESAIGKSAPNNNLFGIKATGYEKQEDQVTKEFVNGKWIVIEDGFRCYDSWLDSIEDHSRFLQVNKRYANAGFFTRCNNLDFEGATWALQSAGYATDPGYAQKLIYLINIHHLYKYDQEAVANMKAIDDLQKRVTDLEKAGEKVPAPDWFVKEFGTEVLKGIVSNPLHDIGFWEDVAVTIRFNKK